MGYSCKLCSKTISQNASNCTETWQETLRAFFAVKGEVVCDTCVDEIFEKCFTKVKRGRKYVVYESKKKEPNWKVGGTFNREKKC